MKQLNKIPRDCSVVQIPIHIHSFTSQFTTLPSFVGLYSVAHSIDAKWLPTESLLAHRYSKLLEWLYDTFYEQPPLFIFFQLSLPPGTWAGPVEAKPASTAFPAFLPP